MNTRPTWRTLLVLGRVSNLPTVWSNVLAGWWLAGGEDWPSLLAVSVSATCFYLGGMFLNDAADVAHDRQHRPERPIPAGGMGRGAVAVWGMFWMAAGGLAVVGQGSVTILWAGLLGLAILGYNMVHQHSAWAVMLLGLCRAGVVLLAASAAPGGANGLAAWSAVVLGVYVCGLSLLARRPPDGAEPPRWPLVLLGAPLVLAHLVNDGGWRTPSFLLSLVLVVWLGRVLGPRWRLAGMEPEACVPGLLAGIVLVDLLAVCGGPAWLTGLFLLLFLLARLGQRFVPAD